MRQLVNYSEVTENTERESMGEKPNKKITGVEKTNMSFKIMSPLHPETATNNNVNFEEMINNAEVVVENIEMARMPNFDTKIDRIIDLLTEIKVNQEFLSERITYIENLLGKKMNTPLVTSAEGTNPMLPFMDVAAIQQYEEELRENEDVQKCLVRTIFFFS